MRFGGSPSSGERSPNRAEPLPAVSYPSALPSSPPVEGILEEDVEFDDATGHDHGGSGGTGTPITLAGDVAGDNTAAVVVGLQTNPVDSVAPNTDDVLTWDGAQWTPQAPAATTAALDTIGGWCRANINPITTPSEMFDAAGAQPFQALMLQDGNCVGIGVSLSGDVGAAGVSYLLELYKNGVATGQTVSVVGSPSTQDRSVNISFSEAFIRTDLLTLYDSNTGSAPAAVYARGWVMVEYTP